jgi:hypothetical protein
VEVVHEPAFSRKGSNSDDAFQQLSEVREDRGTRVGLHATKITTSVEVTDCELTVSKADEDSWK